MVRAGRRRQGSERQLSARPPSPHGRGEPPLLEQGLWHPVACGTAVGGAQPLGCVLLEREVVLWRDASGGVHAFEDRCPHRGTRLSIGRVLEQGLECAYHGWCFGARGRCERIPALPEFQPAQAHAARAYEAAERYGLVWVRLAAADALPAALAGPPPFPHHGDPRLRTLVCGPYDVATSAPRVVENFLDLAHFAFVHEGSREHPRIDDYAVQMLPEAAGVLATGCRVWQPRSNVLAGEGAWVDYGYRVTGPYSAVLTKRPQAWQDYDEAIALFVQPVTQESSRAWFVLAMTAQGADDEAIRAFQDAVFAQDRPVVEAQRPRRLPLAPQAEAPCAADRLSQAYRRYLSSLGVGFGTC